MSFNQNFADFFLNNKAGSDGGATPNAAPATSPSGMSLDFGNFFPEPKPLAPSDKPAQPTTAGEQPDVDSPFKSLLGGSFRQSSAYGNRRDPFSGRDSLHGGVDLAAPAGTSIHAAASGRVVHVGDKNDGYGKSVEIEHADGTRTRYAHASQTSAQVGQEVKAGDQIARVGSTGRSTGNHLHFEVVRNGKSVDPTEFFKAQAQARSQTQTQAPTAQLPDLGQAKPWGEIVKNPEFQALDAATKAQAKAAYFDYWVAPHAGAQAGKMREQFLGMKDPSISTSNPSISTKEQAPSLMDQATAAANRWAGVQGKAGEVVGQISNAIQGLMPSATPSAEPTASELEAASSPALNYRKPGSTKSDSVMDAGVPMQALSTTSKAPVRPEVRAAFNAQWDAATPEQREKMAQLEGVYGQLARDRAGVFANSDSKLPPKSVADKLDPRIEKRRQELIAKGEDPLYADRAALEAAIRGVTPGREIDFMNGQYGTLSKSELDFETKALFNNQTGANNPLVRGTAKALLGTGKAALGLYQAYFDFLGADETSAALKKGGDYLRLKEEAIGNRGPFLERNLEGAISSIGQQIPWLVAGVASGSQVLPLVGVALQTFGQEYSDGTAAGQTGVQAATRASIFSAFEVIGEKFGLKQQMAALRGAARGMSNDEIIRLLSSALKREVPGELLTTTGQFAADKWMPKGYALNPNATTEDFVRQVADTIAQTVMQSGLMGAGTTGVSTARRFMGEQGYSASIAEADAERARTAALNKWDGFIKPSRNEPAFSDSSQNAPNAPEQTQTPDGRLEPTIGEELNTPSGKAEPTFTISTDRNVTVTYPNDPVEPPQQESAPPATTTPQGPEQVSDQEILDFASTRYQQLRQKRDGSLQTEVGDTGMVDREVPGVGLSQTEAAELEALKKANMDPAVLRQLYGLDQQPATQEQANAQTQVDGATPSTDTVADTTVEQPADNTETSGATDEQKQGEVTPAPELSAQDKERLAKAKEKLQEFGSRLEALKAQGQTIENNSAVERFEGYVAEAKKVIEELEPTAKDSQSPVTQDRASLPPVDPAVLEEKGEPIETAVDAERRFAAGERIFAFHEMDELPKEIMNTRELEGYSPDQLLALPVGYDEAPQKPRTEKEARAQRAQQKEAANGTQATETKQTETKGSETPNTTAIAPANQPPTTGLYVELDGKRFPVDSYEDASNKWSDFRDATGAGASEIGNGVKIMDGSGKHVASVSYNGRVTEVGAKTEKAKRLGYDTKVEVSAKILQDAFERDNGESLVSKPEKLEAWRNGTAKTDPTKSPIEVGFNDRGAFVINDGRHRIALAAERGENVSVMVDGKDAERLKALAPNKAPQKTEKSVAEEKLQAALTEANKQLPPFFELRDDGKGIALFQEGKQLPNVIMPTPQGIAAAVKLAQEMDAGTPPAKSKATPQVPNEPGTKYVIPSFATGQQTKAKPKTEKESKAVKFYTAIAQPISFDFGNGKINITTSIGYTPEAYEKTYGEAGGILNFELRGDGVNSETGYKSVAGVIYKGDLDEARFAKLTERVARENAKPEDKPKTTKPKTEKESKKKATAKQGKAQAEQRMLDLLGARVGDTITFNKDIGYVSANKPMLIESVSPNGELSLRNPDGKSGTFENLSQIQAQEGRGLTWSVTPADKPKTEKEAKAKAEPVSEEKKLVIAITKVTSKKGTVGEFIEKNGKATFVRAVELGMLDNDIKRPDSRLFGTNKFAYELQKKYYDSNGTKLTLKKDEATPKTEKAAKVEQAVREMTEDGRAKDGQPIKGNDVFRTMTGRTTTPYPVQKSERYASQWLIDNATAEAESRGDDFNAKPFKRTTINKSGELNTADREAMTMYLFGEQPKVVPSVLKPLSETPTRSTNKIFTDDAAAKARALLKSKLGQINSGIDPEVMQAGITLAGYHIEKGARTFAAYAKAMIADLGDAVKPYLKSWYMGVKYDPRASNFDGMDTAADVEAFNVDQKVEETLTPAAKIDIFTPEGKFEVAQKIADFLIGDGSFTTIIDARKKITEITGQEIKPATEAAKQADEAIETGVVLAGQEIVKAGRKQGRAPQVIYDRLLSLYNRQPNLAVRSSTSMRDQAYSTPVPLAYVASELAGITADSKVYEPTAGNGMLVIGASPKNTVVNELNKKRGEMLKRVLNGAEVQNNNAATWAPDQKFDAVIENPPFGATKDANGNTIVYEVKPNFGTREVDHAIVFKSLETMKDNGRAVLIVGGVQADGDDARREDYRGKNKRTFYFNLYNDYNVVDHFAVDGSLYYKQGASYPVDVIVIEGRGKSSRELPASDLPKIIGSYDELKEKLNGTRSVESRGNSSTTGTDSGNDQAGAGSNAQSVDRGPVGPRNRSGQTGSEPGTSGSTSVSNAESSDRGQSESGGRGTGQVQPKSANALESSGDGQRSVSSKSKRAAAGNNGSAETNGSSKLGGDSVVNGERVGSGLTDRRGQEQETETQVAYKPHSGASSVGTLVPKAMRDAIDASLQKIEDEVGSIDQYVADSLDLPLSTIESNFSAEQVDALALSIKNAQEGRGFIIGDQTGIGKGRVVAAMIRYALVNGKTPIFVTEKPNLYSDMIRDLDDIGMTKELGLDTKSPRIFVTNGGESIPYTLLRTVKGEVTETNLSLKSPKSGKALDDLMRGMIASSDMGDYKVIFTTYSQLQTVKGKGTERQNFVRHFGENNYMIFDESHNAGGGGETQARSKEQRQAEKEGEGLNTGRAAFVRKLVAKAFGTFFSSATYAKRPDVMDLYSSTNMKLAVDRPSELGEAIKRGGVPMQQVVANMLTTDGQYIRRERTFAGVSYDTQETKVDKQTAENMANAMRAILAFSRAKDVVVKSIQKEMDKEGKIAKAMGGEASTIQGANFGSIMHNLIDQMLLALKVQDSVKHAIARLKAGEKVVMTVSNTMGSFLENYAEEMGINKGDPVALSFADLYNRYLEKQRMVTIKDSAGNKTQQRLTDAELGPRLVAQFASIREQINNAGFGEAPISLIDYLHSELNKAGYKTDEITGRTITLNYASGTPILTSRTANIRQRVNAVRSFNNGDTDVIILNQAGSTGLSLHAASKFKDQRKRHMIIVQAEKNIDTHMQMLGRVHRTGQVIPPAYSQMMADIPAEMRPASVLMKKMASLNANTTASRKSSVTAEGVVDFMNDYGGQIVHEYLRDNPEVLEALGGNKVLTVKEDSSDASEEDIRKFTGYIPILPIKQQEEIYKDLIDRYNELLERENSMGTNKLEAKAVDLDAKTISTQAITEDRGDPSIFATPASMERVDVKRTVKPYSLEEVRAMVKDRFNGKAAALIAKEQLTDLAAKGQEFIDQRIAKMQADEVDPIRVDGQKGILQLVLGRAQAILSNFVIGDQISIKDKEGMTLYGVITDITNSGRTANPAAGSAWKMQIALANGDSKTLNLNFSQIGSRYDVEQAGRIDWYNPETQTTENIRVMDIFDKGATVMREKRWMVTGNILAGFAKFPGQIISYTKDDGTVAQGVLMSRQFDFESEQKNAPFTIKTADDAMKFLTEGGYGASIGSPDGVMKITMRGRDFVFTTPSSKREGGSYFLDQKLTDALKIDFYKSGQIMKATSSYADRAKSAIDYLINEREERIVALTNVEKAREMLGKKGESQTFNTTTGDALPYLKQKYGDKPANFAEALRAAEQITGLSFGTQITMVSGMPSEVMMRVDLDTRALEINADVQMTQAQAVQYLIEELIHRVDALGKGSKSISAGSPRLDPTTGDLGIEVVNALKNNTEGLGEFLMYPLHPQYGLDLTRIKGELFARLGVLYFTEPEKFARAFPNAYDLYSRLVPIEVSGDNRILRKVWGTDAGDVRQDGSGSRPLGGDQQGSGQSSQSRQADRGLERLRAAIAKSLGAPQEGVVVKGNSGFFETRNQFNNIQRKVQNNIIQFFGNQNPKTFNWYDRNISTQYNKALKDKHFGKVYSLLLGMQNHVSMASIRAANIAPGIMPRVDDFKSAAARVFSQSNREHVDNAAKALFAGTLAGDTVLDGKVWTDDELRNNFRLNDTEIALYYQARAAINASLDEVSSAEAYSVARGYLNDKVVRAAVIESPSFAEGTITNAMNAQIKILEKLIEVEKKAGNEDKVLELTKNKDEYQKALVQVEKIFLTSANLKRAGYVPLMRFGEYTVSAQYIDPQTGDRLTDADGNPQTAFFGRFETKSEANNALRELQKDYSGRDDVSIKLGTYNDTKHELYAGVDPETLQLFAEAIGADQLMKAQIRLAKSDRSALKRRLERKGTPGYNTDLPRVMASFITSNARHAAQQLYMGAVSRAIKYIPNEKGDVQKEAQRLRNFVVNPSDNGAFGSGLMFAWFLGGSPAAAAVNATQPFMVTMPYLSQFVTPDKASVAMAKAAPYAMGKKEITDPELRKALKKASLEGVVDAQEIFHLYSLGSRQMAMGTKSQAALTLWGSMFSAIEGLNRRMSFIAAWDIAKQTGEKNPYAFAIRAVNSTQGIYNKVNRPNLAQSTIGRLVFTYKGYAIMIAELMFRMWKSGPQGKRAVFVMLAMLMLASGEEGLPGAKMLDDLIDTIGQMLGFDTNARRWKRRTAYELLGKSAGDLFLYGVSSKLPLDFSGRLGLGSMIPGTEGLKPSSEILNSKAMEEVAGPAAGLLNQVRDAVKAANSGNYVKAAENLSPKAVRDVVAAASMLSKGYATDSRGNKTVNTTGLDAVIKGFGFNPTVVAENTREKMPIRQDERLRSAKATEFSERLQRALMEKDEKTSTKDSNQVMADIEKWNKRNPDTMIDPVNIRNSGIRRARDASLDSDERTIKRAPKTMRERMGLDMLK